MVITPSSAVSMIATLRSWLCINAVSAALAQALSEHFPGPLSELFAAQHAGDFAHLRWDLGYDFCLPEPGATAARIDKVGFYGIL